MKLDGGREAAESSKSRGISGVYWPAFCLRREDQEHQGRHSMLTSGL